ncbi:5-formyltetrahydrofolate cyclo-ligase [Specibacter sp. NPDC078692]|uniref:5-formyltetrahydrofolate cyclo-ligase n=1 Tax=Specibacter sp. NPDC078692 TaxID=3155818 RepID=UPI0034362662
MDKVSLRSRIRARRRAAACPAAVQSGDSADTLSANTVGVSLTKNTLDWLATLSGNHPGMVVCAYISTGYEPPTQELLRACTAAGYIVHVPVCEPDFQLSWVRWHSAVELVRSAWAPVMEPLGARIPFEALVAGTGAASSHNQLRAIIVPALAVDAEGTRLGQGGGYYDRFLAGVSGVPLAAVIYDDEYLPAGALPYDSLDMPVHYALSPSAWIPLGAAHHSTVDHSKDPIGGANG